MPTIRTKAGAGNRGQMAIFVALLFQILFVFFAMIINIGLVVHDKINLQNSIDLGAIYAAQRQAELLNMIGHTNYQMRQSYKLLTWRIRVLGNLGRATHPLTSDATKLKPQPEEADPGIGSGGEIPAICLANGFWVESTKGGSTDLSNLCQTNGKAFPKLPKVQIVAPFNPITAVVKGFVDKMGAIFDKNCEDMGPLSFLFASGAYIHFKAEQRYRRKIIDSIALELSEKKSDFADLRADSVLEGVRNTVIRNLTRSNLARISRDDIKMFNSLGEQDPRIWLPPIATKVFVPYLDFISTDGSCKGALRWVHPTTPNGGVKENNPLGQHIPFHFKAGMDPGGVIQSNLYDDNNPNSPFHPSIGVEKNPWYLAYVGVSVRSTKSVKMPFSPFSRMAAFTAQAFAQPFGGRIGPWYGSKWDQSASKSSGKATDGLLPARVTGTFSFSADQNDLPNYSKYPGDKLGLTSKMALGALGEAFFLPAVQKVSFYKSYKWFIDDVDGNLEREALAWDSDAGQAPKNRDFEVAAIAPDMFDIAYYSIDPNFIQSYLRFQNLKDEKGLPIWSDLGARSEGPLKMFNIEEEIKNYAAKKYPSWVKYIVRNPFHVLTGWSQQGAVDYGFPDATKFGACPEPDMSAQNPELAVPGRCLMGGRVGYSVKIVSKDFLSGPMSLGDSGANPIKNQPPESF
ncbi:MAG: Tad domain-containing protein [Bdellovibrionia bacterium]